MKELVTTLVAFSMFVVAGRAEDTQQRIAQPGDSITVSTPKTELDFQYEVLQRDLQKRNRILQYADETFEAESLIAAFCFAADSSTQGAE